MATKGQEQLGVARWHHSPWCLSATESLLRTSLATLQMLWFIAALFHWVWYHAFPIWFDIFKQAGRQMNVCTESQSILGCCNNWKTWFLDWHCVTLLQRAFSILPPQAKVVILRSRYQWLRIHQSLTVDKPVTFINHTVSLHHKCFSCRNLLFLFISYVQLNLSLRQQKVRHSYCVLGPHKFCVSDWILNASSRTWGNKEFL